MGRGEYTRKIYLPPCVAIAANLDEANPLQFYRPDIWQSELVLSFVP